ncbi:MAG: YihY/virulence factor BrkB family protein [Clostridia bacterium]|nr:YihY/virulence factor BrkB family protein [Clostridia bacterium]
MRIIDTLKLFYAELTDKKYTTIAGTLVFFLIMSLLPFMFWLFLLFGKFHLQTEQILELDVFEGVKELLLYCKQAAQEATSGATLTLLMTTMYSSTNLFYHMRRSGEIIFDDEQRKGGWRLRFSALMLLLLMFLFFFSAGVVLLFGKRLFERMFVRWLADLLVYLLLFLIAFGILLILNFYICPYRLRWRDVFPGCFLSTTLWIAASVGFGLYLKFFQPNRLYGKIAVFFVFLLWIYLMISCFIIGVIYNAYCLERHHLVHKKY